MIKFFIRLALTLSLTFFVSTTYGQITITGIVLDSVTNTPVAKASVYINNTTIGTTTDGNGYFNLNTTSDQGQLVISHVAFQKHVAPLSLYRQRQKITVKLIPQEASLNEVTINGSGLASWKKWRALFTRYFIGVMPFAKKCKVINPEVLRFHYDKKQDLLNVTSTNTLIVRNRALGYIYKMDLNNFNYSFTNLRVNIKLTIYFENIDPVDSSEQQRFLTNRKYAFDGSLMHFLRGIYQKNYMYRGFTVTKVRSLKNKEKQRVAKMVSDAIVRAYKQNEDPSKLTLEAIAHSNNDSLQYYQKVLSESNNIVKDTLAVSLSDSLRYDSKTQSAKLNITDTLFIQYSEAHDLNPTQFKFPIKKNGFLITESEKSFHRKIDHSMYQYSIAYLVGQEGIAIYDNGEYDGSDIFTIGYIASGKIAYLLPWNYHDPDDKSGRRY